MKQAPVAWSLVAVVLLGGTLARAQSLAEVAKKEGERRKAVKGSTKVYTNDDLRKYPTPPPPPDATTPPSGGEAASAGDAAKPDAAKPGADQVKSPEDGAKDEAYWKGQLSGARTKLERDKSYLEALQSRVNALTNDFYARDDPAQRGVLWAQRSKALEEMDRLRTEIAEGTKTIAKIQEDARRAGVPPGWLR